MSNVPRTRTLRLQCCNGLCHKRPTRHVRTTRRAKLLGNSSHTGIRRRFGHGGHGPNSIGILTYAPALRVNVSVKSLSAIVLSSVPPARTRCVRHTNHTKQHSNGSLILTMTGAGRRSACFCRQPGSVLKNTIGPPRVFLSTATMLRHRLATCTLSH